MYSQERRSWLPHYAENIDDAAFGAPRAAPLENRYPGGIVEPARLAPRAVSTPDFGRDPRRVSQSVYDPSRYGDMQIIPAVFVGGDSQLILSRPANTRIMLMIQNNLAVGNVVFTFDQQAAANNGFIVVPGQTIILDSKVPQNDLYLFAAAAGTVTVGFINSDIANRQ